MNVMKQAHQIAKTITKGTYRERLAIGLRQAWKEAKQPVVINKKAKFETREEALQHISVRPNVAKKQTDMINTMYSAGLKVSLNAIEAIEYDCHCDTMKKAMSF